MRQENNFFSDADELDIRIDNMEEMERIPKNERPIPIEITESILQKEKLPELPKLKSAIVEDFVAQKIEAGVCEPKVLAELFINEGGLNKIQKMIDEVKDKSQSLDWEKVFSIDDAKRVQKSIGEEMASMGASDEQIAALLRTNVAIAESVGSSGCTNNGVYVSRLQIVRKTMDYMDVFGKEISFEKLVRHFMTATISHELGHKIDSITGIASNRIELDEGWRKNGDTEENRSERFAEFWGRSLVDNKSRAISDREWLIQTKKVYSLWNTIEKYNSAHQEKADLMFVLEAIRERLENFNFEASVFLEARMDIYGNAVVENYALPYSRAVVEKAIRQ